MIFLFPVSRISSIGSPGSFSIHRPAFLDSEYWGFSSEDRYTANLKTFQEPPTFPKRQVSPRLCCRISQKRREKGWCQWNSPGGTSIFAAKPASDTAAAISRVREIDDPVPVRRLRRRACRPCWQERTPRTARWRQRRPATPIHLCIPALPRTGCTPADRNAGPLSPVRAGPPPGTQARRDRALRGRAAPDLHRKPHREYRPPPLRRHLARRQRILVFRIPCPRYNRTRTCSPRDRTAG